MDIVQFVATSALVGFGTFVALYIVSFLVLALSPLPPVSVMARQKRMVVKWSTVAGVLAGLSWLAWGAL